MTIDPITLEVIRHGFSAIAEEMNAALIRTGYSPNIKERQDCSCAVFDASGRMLAQAENIPVHLGAMPFSVASAIEAFPPSSLAPGDAILVNDPYRGGAHLPDLTLISPVHRDGEVEGFVANRAHHADIGGAYAGSIAAEAEEIYQEGLRIPPVRLYRSGELEEELLAMILANVRATDERRGDLRAQQAANQTGVSRYSDLAARHGTDTIRESTDALLDYAEQRMQAEIDDIPDGTYAFTDVIEDDGKGRESLEIHASVTVSDEEIIIDFSGSAEQSSGAINAVRAVTVSATYYAIRCITDPTIPANAGCYRPLEVRTTPGTLVNATPPAAVVGGNLETSQRIVDVVLGALNEALPDRAVAASQGTMNNLTIGGINPETGMEYAFYETQAGGAGAGSHGDGQDAVQVHMTNTKNTPIEVLETAYPCRVQRYALRPGSGGAGQYRGGLGIRRDIEIREGTATVSVLSERRLTRPYGIKGGEAGHAGKDVLIDEGESRILPAKSVHTVSAGTIVSMRTPGGGGYGDKNDRSQKAIERDEQLGKTGSQE